ncbi:conserved hypothetical protein [Klebsiella pneumoniae subsp. pneumoniae Ecl8]|jgi:hypothetical protein|nr:hypothetical protein KPN2242_01365 [Klebsiella pneumoniae KCTC 2242]MCS5845642.1 hypothetical protein [Klebsiella pneumoniae subsp. pneumoniae]MCS6036438.1 hypothetical protein [Klebsiella pneumoniae subsp. pneumoniae]CCN27767.1 conserved hypothetical protein [Klebsiella pneumoniae subsp. pneumoniae Ecl8]
MITIAGGMEIDATLHAHIAGKKRVIIAKSGTNQAIAKFDKASSFTSPGLNIFPIRYHRCDSAVFNDYISAK